VKPQYIEGYFVGRQAGRRTLAFLPKPDNYRNSAIAGNMTVVKNFVYIAS